MDQAARDRLKIATGKGRRAARLGILSPLRSIRAKCLDCTCQQPKEVRDCRIVSCALWPYRLGRYPKAAPALGQEDGR